MPYVTLIKMSEHGIALNLDSGGGVLSTATSEEMVQQWEEAYDETMYRGSTWAASTALHWMQFQPAVIEIAGIDDLRERFFGGEETATARRARSISGSLDIGIIPNQEAARASWNDGVKPRLVKER